MNRGLSLSNTNDIIANSIHLIQGNVITDILDLINAHGVNTNDIINALLADQTFIDALAAAANDSYTKTESNNLFYTKSYLDNALIGKVNVNTLNSYYLKTQIDTNHYTKTQINTLLLGKQPVISTNDLSISNINLLQMSLDNLDVRILTNYNSINNLYTKSEIDTNIYTKSQINTTFLNHYLKTQIDTNIYTKTEVNNLLVNKQSTIGANDLNISDINLLQMSLDNLDVRILTNHNSINNLYTKSEIDTNIYTKSQVNTTFLNHYLKTQIDNNHYTKTQIDTKFTSYYSKTYIDVLIGDYYNKSAVDTLLNGKNNLITVTDSAGVSHTDINTIIGGSVSNGVLTLPSGGSSYDDTSVRGLIAANTTSISTNTTAINNRRTIADSYTKTDVNTFLLQKHPTLTMRAAGVDYAGVTTISVPNGSVSNGVLTVPQLTISNGSLQISQTQNLQSALDVLMIGKATVAQVAAVSASVATKQDTIGVNDLSISDTNLLQTELDDLDTRVTSNFDAIAALDLSSISGLSTALHSKMDSGDQLQIWSTGSTYNVITHLKINGSTVTFNGSFAEVTISDLVTLSNTVNDQITGLTSKVSSNQFTTTTNNLDAAIVAVETDILTKQNEITVSNRISADLIHDGTVSNTEFSYLNNVSGNIQSQLTGKVNSGQVLTNVPANAIFTDANVKVFHNNSLIDSALNGQGLSFTNAAIGYSLTGSSVGCLEVTSTPDYTQVVGLSTQLALKKGLTFDAVLNPTAYFSTNGTWTEDATTTTFAGNLQGNRITTGSIYNAASGPMTSANGERIQYQIPASCVGGSVFLNYWANTTGGYADIYMRRFGYSENSHVCRLNTYAQQSSTTFNNNDGLRVECISSGWTDFDMIEFRVRRGRLNILSLGFSKDEALGTVATSVVHSQNVIGDPASLSDTRLKDNQAVVQDSTMSAIFDAIQPKEYDLHSQGDQPSERRVGFIANDVQNAISGTGWTNIIGSKPIDEEEYLTLDYSRLVTVLWGKVKSLESRLKILEG